MKNKNKLKQAERIVKFLEAEYEKRTKKINPRLLFAIKKFT